MLAYLEWLALYAGIAVGSHVAHASTLVNCSAGNPAGSYYSSSDSTGNGAWQNTGVYMQPCIQGPPNGSGILIWESPIGNGAGYAVISVGGTAAAGSGAIVLSAPNGVSVFGTMVTSGLSTFQAGVNMSGTRISNLAPGTVSATSTDGVNASQLYGLANSTASALGGGTTVAANGALGFPSFASGGTTYTSVGGVIAALNGGSGIKYFHSNSTLADSNAAGVDSVAIGGNAVATAASSVALGTGSVANGANTVSVGAVSAERKLVNVAAGTVTSTSTDAVNGAQLFQPEQQIAGQAGGGLVQQNSATRQITVGATTDGTVINVSGTMGNRQVSGVAVGAVGAQSSDAVNGSQLYGLVTSVATSLGGGATVNPDGTLAAPAYSVGGNVYNDVGSALNNLDRRTAVNSAAIANLDATLGAINAGGGIMYFHANSTLPDSFTGRRIRFGRHRRCSAGFCRQLGGTGRGVHREPL